MPEEINRALTDALADYLFVTEEDAVDNLVREGRSLDCIYLVGNVMIDALRQFLPLAQESRLGEELGLRKDNGFHSFAVLTLHRPSNVDSSEKLESLLNVIEEVAERLPVVFPVHPRTQKILAGLGSRASSRLKLIPPVGYLDFLFLLSRAKLVLTDSGGIQEETTALGVPCLTLRENTERPVTVTHGTNEIVGLDSAKIRNSVDTVLAGKWKTGRLPQLWDGHAAQRIVDVLMTRVSSFAKQGVP
jgi:UDP-N-acetylglucosamine 2-epimerase (non-hydrolysing)